MATARAAPAQVPPPPAPHSLNWDHVGYVVRDAAIGGIAGTAIGWVAWKVDGTDSKARVIGANVAAGVFLGALIGAFHSEPSPVSHAPVPAAGIAVRSNLAVGTVIAHGGRAAVVRLRF